MRSSTRETLVRTVGFAVAVLVSVGASLAQVDLTARQASVTLPDGRTVPMWGLFCAPGSNTDPSSGPTCSALDGSAQGATAWQPPLIRAQAGSSLTIELHNDLPGSVPTSLFIVGQLGGGLGTPTKVDSPEHAVQGTTWPVAGDSSGPVFVPPAQGQRIQSFGTEVGQGAAASLTWTNLRAGTYLVESGTHPSIQGPMGLYGVLVVSSSPTEVYPGIAFDKDVPLLLSEIDATQNAAVAAAVAAPGFSETSVRVLRDFVSSVSPALDPDGNALGGSGYQVGDAVVFSGGGAAAVATAHVSAVDGSGAITEVTVDDSGVGYSTIPGASVTSGTGSGAQLVAALSLAGTLCSDGASACYPPVVNYDPRYYLINGAAFDKTNPAASTFPGPTGTATTGNLLLRFVNAGLRMHVPSVVGADMALVAEDGNVQPDIAVALAHNLAIQYDPAATPRPKFQNSVFLAAGKTFDVMLHLADAGAAYPQTALPVFDRQLSLSANNQRDGGMLAYIGVNGGGNGGGSSAFAADDNYYLVPDRPLVVSEPAKGMLGNDHNIYGVVVTVGPTGQAAGGFSWKPDGTFSYTPAPGTTSDSFTYQAANNPAITATVHLNPCDAACLGSAPTAFPDEYTSNVVTVLRIAPSGVLANDKSNDGYPLTAAIGTCTADPGYACLGPAQVSLRPDGSFVVHPGAAGDYEFAYRAVQTHGLASADTLVKLHFPPASNLQVRVLDGPSTLPGRSPVRITDYRWIIEEDRTFHIDSASQVNTGTYMPNLGANFHSSYMPVVAQGCVGTVSCETDQSVLVPGSGHAPAVCDLGNGACRTDSGQQEEIDPSQVHLDPNKRYYISVLPGDGANPILQGSGGPMPVNPADPDGPQRPFSIPLDCPQLDADNNGDADSDFAPGSGACGHGMGGAPIQPGQLAVNVPVQQTPLPTGKISVFVFEDDSPLNGECDAGGGVDILATNEPGLGGFEITILDQAGGFGDSTGQPTYDMMNMPLSNALANTIDPVTGLDACPISPNSTDGMVGMIVTCPKYESDGTTLSPLAGQAMIANLYPGLYEVVATPSADRIARGEEWLQTNTLDGTKPHEAFVRVGEPGYFQEFGPAGYHVSIGFANPAIINARKAKVCQAADCTHTVTGQISTARISRTPDERIYGSGDFAALGFTSCYVSLGDPAAADFAFAKCEPDGSFTFANVPPGNHKITIFDQWNDIIVDGLSLPIGVPNSGDLDLGELPMMQWRTNLATRTYVDVTGDGVSQPDEPGLPLVPVNVRYRDGSFMGFNSTDMAGYAGFNEIFPFFNWMVIEADTTRYKQTGVHVVYDAGGPADGTGQPNGGGSVIADHVANTKETFHLPADLRFPGSVYCSDADCSTENLLNFPHGGGADGSTGRIDPAWVTTEGWQGFAGHTQFFEFGKAPFAENENGGIRGHVVYASTRPFDDPQLLLQLSWEPLVPNVTVNLYKEGTAPDGTTSLTLVDTTRTSSWDEWAQGFRIGPNNQLVPNMNCPGQDDTSPFFFTLKDSPNFLSPGTPLPYNSRYKCYDGMAILNQAQPAPYDGMYQFPSVTGRDPLSGAVTASNCTGCVDNPVDHTPMLPPGKYVVEMIVPPGYELVKEEDKNILFGDVYVAPVTQQFAGLGNIFIMPDQAEVDAEYNPDNPLNSTVNEGVRPRHEGDTGSVETFWPCVGEARIVPDYNSLFPAAQQAAPFAGATRRLCDRKEVTLEDQSTALAKFYVFSSTHVAAHFTGIITDDYAAEFDPFSPMYGEKLAIPNLPVSFKDPNGIEVSRTYSDQWGFYNGLYYSSWEVNPPNPTGYGPAVTIACMNDSGAKPDGSVDPLYNPGYSQFCYEWSLMPGQTAYMDTPVVPVMAFAEGYNPPDCAYPEATPAIRQVDGDGDGPWVAAVGSPVQSVNLTGGGGGYICNPAVSFNGDGSGASATDSLGVNAVNVNNRGGGYTQAPTVVFAPTDGNGSGAAASATMRLDTIPVADSGRYYSNRPSLVFDNTGTGGSGATARVNDLKVVQVDVRNGGSGYISAPAITFDAPDQAGGVTATGFATISGGKITSITVTNPGSGYNNAAGITITPRLGNALASSVMGVNTILVQQRGSGYATAPLATVPAPSTPNYCNSFPCSPATATVTVLLQANAIGVTNPGSGYTHAPNVTLVANGSGSGATASAAMTVNSITLTNGGSGYTAPPAVVFTNSCSGGSGASAQSQLGGAGSHTLTIVALGDQNVPNHAYSGPNATTAPFNQKFITRHYGFGTRCTNPTLNDPSCNTVSGVTIGGVAASIQSWSDQSIQVTVPGGVPLCTIQQRGETPARCGELVITAGNGKRSTETVTVTIGGKAPTYVDGPNANNDAIQTAIDHATPGDLIIVKPGMYKEMVIMWKPVRLQGVGAGAVTINGDPHPAGRLDPWRRKVQCLFGLNPDGRPGQMACDEPSLYFQTDRIPLEGITGWDTTVNGNLAELLAEPTLMGAYEGAGITVVGKGVRYPEGVDPFGTAAEAEFPDGTTFLTNSQQD